MTDGKSVPVMVRLSPEQAKALDDWRRDQSDLPGRPEAIRRLIEASFVRDTPGALEVAFSAAMEEICLSDPEDASNPTLREMNKLRPADLQNWFYEMVNYHFVEPELARLEKAARKQRGQGKGAK